MERRSTSQLSAMPHRALNRLAGIVKPVWRLERGVLAGLALAAAAFWGFIEIADEVIAAPRIRATRGARPGSRK